jgi:hypothetical protein
MKNPSPEMIARQESAAGWRIVPIFKVSLRIDIAENTNLYTPGI